jgi:hypothetical protein
MKRHPALHPLSHDHHQTLVLALRLKKGGPASPNDNWPTELEAQRSEVLRIAQRDLFPHFDSEELWLFGSVPSLSEAESILLEDHKQIRALVAKLEQLPANAFETLKSLGEALESHVRKEEREYFPKLQEVLSEEDLVLLGEKLRGSPVAPGS